MKLATTLAILLGVTLAVITYGCTRQSDTWYHIVLYGSDGVPIRRWSAWSIWDGDGYSAKFRDTVSGSVFRVRGNVVIETMQGTQTSGGVRQ